MNKFILTLLGLVMTLGAAAQTAEQQVTGQPAGYYLRGTAIDDWSTNSEIIKAKCPQFYWDEEEGQMSAIFDRTTGDGSYNNCVFAISFGTDWNNYTIVAGHNTNFVNNSENEIYYGGNRNANFPTNTYIYKITVKLPTNSQQVTGDNPSWPEKGQAGWLRFEDFKDPYYNSNNAATGSHVRASDGEDSKSKFLLQVWDMPQYSSELSAPWDISGGLSKPLRNENFKKIYNHEIDDTKFITFYKVKQASLVQANSTTDDDGNTVWLPVTNYDANEQIVQYHTGSNVYVIDFKGDYNSDGLYVEVPNSTMIDDALITGTNAEDYKKVPKVLRSGIRFGILNDNISTDNASNNKYRFLKYGRDIHLNELPREIGNGSYANWNGIPESTNPTVDNLSTYDNKLGDNRLISEYNMYIDRIILEVVNESDMAITDVYIRFEGRYDLKPVALADGTFSYSTKGMSTEEGSNFVGNEPNIYVGNSIYFFDRGFSRFYANSDLSYHGYTSEDELINDINKYGLLSYNDSYTTESEYSVQDEAGKTINYIDVDGNENLISTPAEYSVKYKADGETFTLLDENGNETETKEELKYSKTTPDKLKDDAYATQYGNATQLVVQAKQFKLLYDNSEGANSSTLPKKFSGTTTYYFPNAEPNNVPTYEFNSDINPNTSVEYGPAINATADGYNSTGGYFEAKVNVTGSTYAEGTEWNINGEQTQRYPVTRWELSAYDIDYQTGTDGHNEEHDATHGESTTYKYVRSLKGDPINTPSYKEEDFGTTMYYNNNGFDDTHTKRNIGYCAEMFYTFGNVKDVVISEEALKKYTEKDTEGNDKNPYALPFKSVNNADPDENGDYIHTLTSANTETAQDDENGIPTSITVYLRQVSKWAHATVTFETNITTGIEDVAVEAAAPAEYYNLQGVRVSTPAAGNIYIVRRGNKVTKEFIR